jgi:anaerobic magnesium-protoporphyrin IX monomethyl ester cyclase
MKILGLNTPSQFSRNVARDLLWGCWCKGKRIAGVQFPSLPLMYVATVLKQNGFDVDVLDAQALGVTLEELETKITEYDVVFLISATMSYTEDADILARLKAKNPRLKTIIFGSHATFLPEGAIQRSSVDIAVRKEAEFVIRDIIKAFVKGDDSWKQIKGICYMDNGKPVVNPDYPYIENLDELPIPDRSFLPKGIHYYNPIVKHDNWTTALSSRGCPSRCTYCTAPSYYGPLYRARSARNVVDELKYLQDLGFKEVFYRDELFTVNKKRVFDICALIKEEGIKMSWICSVKASTANYEMLKAMKEAGCHMIRVGVESGSQEILDRVKKDVKIIQVSNVFKWARELKLSTHAHLMLGMPGETDETVATTFKFISEIKPTTITYGIMTPYPGTEIYRQVLEADPSFKDGTQIDARSLHTNASFSKIFSEIPQNRLEKYVRQGYGKFYMRPTYVFDRLKSIQSVSDLKRLVMAGSQVFGFVVQGDE